MKSAILYVRFLLIAVYFCCSIIVYSQPMQGDYTIGGVNSDFITISEAIDSLSVKGVAGATIFLIENGTYEEKLEFGVIDGVSDQNNVKFESASGNREDVVIHQTHTVAPGFENYTIHISGTNYLSFKHLTFEKRQQQVSDLDGGRVLFIENEFSHLNFESCTFRSFYNPNGFFDYGNCIHIRSFSDEDGMGDYLHFINNKIIGGDVGLNCDIGSQENNSRYWKITGNQFYDQGETGLELSGARNVEVANNRIVGKDINSNFLTGIKISSGREDVLINANSILSKYGGIGIWCYSTSASALEPLIISNNEIVIDEIKNENSHGIKSDRNVNTLIAHNAINLIATENIGSCFESRWQDTIRLNNNHFIHSAGGYCYDFQEFDQKQISADYNNLYNGLSNLARIDGNTYNFGQLRNQFGIGLNSISLTPLFNDYYNLLHNTPGCYDVGIVIPEVPRDIKGQLRSSITADIGILEGEYRSPDISIAASNFQNPILCANTTIPLYADIRSYAFGFLTSAKIFYQLGNGPAIEVQWNGNLTAFDIEKDIFLGNVAIGNEKEIRLKIWTKEPNGNADLNVYNDTLVVNNYVAMSGDYFIDSVGGDFQTIMGAVDDLENRGVCGLVNIYIQPGLYFEEIDIPIIPGASATNRILFQGDHQDSTAVIFSFKTFNSFTNHRVRLYGSSYLDFRHINFLGTGPSTHALQLFNGASNNTFRHCIFQNSAYNSPNVGWNACVQIYSSVSGCNNNVFEFNTFAGGEEHISIARAKNCLIRNNDFIPFGGNKVGTCVKAVRCDDLVVSENSFTGRCQNNAGLIILEGDCPNLLFEKNYISIANNGIMLGITGSNQEEDQPIIIRNNMMIQTENYINGTGIRFSQSSNIKFINNSVNKRTPGGLLFLLVGNQKISLKNNIFRTDGNSVIYQLDYYYFNDMLDIDYNVLFNQNAYDTNAEIGSLEFQEYNWESWVKETGFDLHSQFIPPRFVSPTDLHIDNAIGLKNAGTILPEIFNDFDNDSRGPMAPDIGADEFELDSLSLLDIAIDTTYFPFSQDCLASDSIFIKVINNIPTDVDSFEVEFSVFGNTKIDSSIVMLIPALDSVLVHIGNYAFVPNTFYQTEIIIDRPNGNDDNFIANNRFQPAHYYIEDLQIYTIVPDDCRNYYELHLSNFLYDIILWSTGDETPTIMVTDPGIYQVTVIDDLGCEFSAETEIE